MKALNALEIERLAAGLDPYPGFIGGLAIMPDQGGGPQILFGGAGNDNVGGPVGFDILTGGDGDDR